MMASLKTYAYAFMAALAAIAGVVLYRMGGKSVETKHVKENLDAAKDAKDARYEMENTDDKRLVDILSGKLRK